MSHNVRDWIESMSSRDVFWMTAAERNEYDRQLEELEARIAARAAANAVNSDRQVQQLAEWSERLRAQRTQGNVTQ